MTPIDKLLGQIALLVVAAILFLVVAGTITGLLNPTTAIVTLSPVLSAVVAGLVWKAKADNDKSGDDAP